MREGFNPYEVLGVERDATPETIRLQWRRLMQREHPDRSTRDDAAEYFGEIEQAGRILLDPERRAHWDEHGAEPGSDALSPERVWVLNAMSELVPRAAAGQCVLEMLRHRIHQEVSNLLHEIEAFQRLLATLPDVMPVHSGAGADPKLFAEALAAGTDGLRSEIDSRDAQIAVLNRASDLLAQYKPNPAAPKRVADPWAAASRASNFGIGTSWTWMS